MLPLKTVGLKYILKIVNSLFYREKKSNEPVGQKPEFVKAEFADRAIIWIKTKTFITFVYMSTLNIFDYKLCRGESLYNVWILQAEQTLPQITKPETN